MGNWGYDPSYRSYDPHLVGAHLLYGNVEWVTQVVQVETEGKGPEVSGGDMWGFNTYWIAPRYPNTCWEGVWTPKIWQKNASQEVFGCLRNFWWAWSFTHSFYRGIFVVGFDVMILYAFLDLHRHPAWLFGGAEKVPYTTVSIMTNPDRGNVGVGY